MKKAFKKIARKAGLGKRGRRRARNRRERARRPLTPIKAVQIAVAALSRPSRADDPAKTIEETKAQAAELTRSLQPRLAPGQRLSIEIDESVAGAEADDDVDFVVSVNPKRKSSKKRKNAGAKVDPKLKKAVDGAGGIKPFLLGTIKAPGGNPTMGFAQFEKLWNAKQANKEFIKDRFRALTAKAAGTGAHEWIPVSVIVDAYRPKSNSPRDLANSARWLRAAETWITPTSEVFISPAIKVGRLRDSKRTMKNVLQGHPGAVYHFEKGKNTSQHKGSRALHTPLAGAVRSADGNVASARDGIIAAAKEFMWPGEPGLGAEFSDEHRDSAGNILGKSVLSRRAKKGVEDFNKAIKRSLR